MAWLALVLLMMAFTLTGSNSTDSVNVSCLIINLEYINCTWNKQGIPELNYTFHSRFGNRSSYKGCPMYLLEEGLTVGCRMPYQKGEKFYTLHTRLSQDNSSSVLEQAIDLRDLVKLDPPGFLQMEVQEELYNPVLLLSWNISTPSSCVESSVRYRQRGGQWKISEPIKGHSFSLPFFSEDDPYEFQVRARVMHFCHQSRLWSDWSARVLWVPPRQAKRSGQDQHSHSHSTGSRPQQLALVTLLGIGRLVQLLAL